ncbi:MAG: hypothetical protein AW09_004595 [Candidatus Accumulibacter phosphatis]|uniref:Uncharacterized protein n=1 Tax=Candidatus Accumulibacter phosphatis TaxID=327160 RepID=A0A084Y6G7_9PROT|nr:MAG: hypothetical protein AW09_004595 [Candidatus Accumulibacter phosphatis]
MVLIPSKAGTSSSKVPGSGTRTRVQPITSRDWMSRAVTTFSWPVGTAVGSMMPMPKPSFQWLACRPSPWFTPVDQALLTRAVQLPSIAKSFARLSAVQSMSAPAAWLAAEQRVKSSRVANRSKAVSLNLLKLSLASSRSTPLTKPMAWPSSWMAMPTKSNRPVPIPSVWSKSKEKLLLKVICASSAVALAAKSPIAFAFAVVSCMSVTPECRCALALVVVPLMYLP